MDNPTPERRVMVTLRLKPSLIARLEAAAQRQNRARSNLIESLLETAVAAEPAGKGGVNVLD